MLKRILPINYETKPWTSCRGLIINKVIQELIDYDPSNPHENPSLYSSNKTIKLKEIKIYDSPSKDIGPVDGKEISNEYLFINENSNIVPVDILEVEKYNKPKSASNKREIMNITRHSITYKTKNGTIVTEFV
ncbi:hypothetical protein M0R36_09800 [bacterium]|jgi:hypothetical protein|nr:hypothetical protein [bacterium]